MNRAQLPRSAATIPIREIGSFFAGGQVVRLHQQPSRPLQVARNGPARTVDGNGDHITGQCYVQYVRREAPLSEAPLMFWHGGGMTGATWESTPDGRAGWQMYFLRRGFDTCICDAMERGRAGWSPYPEVYAEAPLFRTLEEAWAMFRFGAVGGYSRDAAASAPFPGQQFQTNSFEVLGAQLVPRWIGHTEATLQAYFAALERVGPAWAIAHSQGANLALEAAGRRPELFRGLVVVEPAAAPAEIGRAAEIPHLFLWGDFIAEAPIWGDYREVADAYRDKLLAASATADLLDLPAEGIDGNSHLPMMDRNSDVIAERIYDWLCRQL